MHIGLVEELQPIISLHTDRTLLGSLLKFCAYYLAEELFLCTLTEHCFGCLLVFWRHAFLLAALQPEGDVQHPAGLREEDSRRWWRWWCGEQ